MANIKPVSLVNTKIVHKRGSFNESVAKRLKDGEVFYDVEGKSIYIGVAKGDHVEAIQLGGGSGSGSISEEDLSKLVAKLDIVDTLEDGVIYSAEKVLGASAGLALKDSIKANTDKINVLEQLFSAGTISPEVQQYLQQLLNDSNLSSSATVNVYPVVDTVTQETRVEVAVNTDTQSLDKVQDENGEEKLGTVWAQYDESTASNGATEDGDDEPSWGSFATNVLS